MLFEGFQQNKRKMMSLAFIFFLMLMNHFFSGPYLKIILNFMIWVTYSIILYIPKSWWSRTKVILALLVILCETALGVYWFKEMNLFDLFSVFIFYATFRLSISKSPFPVIAALFVACMLYIKFGKENVFSIISFILLTGVLYFAIRLRIQRNEMYEVNKQQLAKLQEAYEELQEASITSMQYAVLEERARIARDIHDAVGHSLTSLIVQIQALKFMLKENPEEAEMTIERMLPVARQGLQEIRTAVHSLSENQVNSGITPLKALLSRMKATASIEYEFHSDLTDDVLTTTINGVLFKVLQEAITNIIRHSQATLVLVSLKKEWGILTMCVKDNGILDKNDRVTEGFGLKGMKARLEGIGGKLNFKILEPQGFEIKAEIPLDESSK